MGDILWFKVGLGKGSGWILELELGWIRDRVRAKFGSGFICFSLGVLQFVFAKKTCAHN